jgi:hypothetical protein
MAVAERDPLPAGHPEEFVSSVVSPAEQVRIMLARRKAAGITTEWERLWDWCISRVRYEHDRVERNASKQILTWAEPYFRAAYEGRPPPDMLAACIGMLGPLLQLGDEDRDTDL